MNLRGLLAIKEGELRAALSRASAEVTKRDRSLKLAVKPEGARLHYLEESDMRQYIEMEALQKKLEVVRRLIAEVGERERNEKQRP